MKDLSPKWIETLKKFANRKTWEDDADFNPQDFSGGNFDDAYYGGFDDGRTNLARGILTELEEN